VACRVYDGLAESDTVQLHLNAAGKADESGSEGLGGGAIAGIVIGVVVVAAAVGAAVFFLVIRKGGTSAGEKADT
jgi:hypothetical protein